MPKPYSEAQTAKIEKHFQEHPGEWITALLKRVITLERRLNMPKPRNEPKAFEIEKHFQEHPDEWFTVNQMCAIFPEFNRSWTGETLYILYLSGYVDRRRTSNRVTEYEYRLDPYYRELGLILPEKR